MKAYSKILLFVTAMALIVLVSSSPFHSGVAAETKKISERFLFRNSVGCCCPGCHSGCSCCCAKIN